MNGNSKQNKLGKEEIMKILEEKGWVCDRSPKRVDLYREDNEEAGNCFMHIRGGIIAFKAKKTIILEIETDTSPKSFIGTIGCIDISNYYKIKEEKLKSLKDVTFFILISEKEKTKKKEETTKEQIKTVNNYFKVEKGSLKDFRVMTIEEFENLL